VLVVGPDRKPGPRPVKLRGAAQGNRWIVESGLAEGEQVVVDGFQKLAFAPPGSPVNPVPWDPNAAPAAPAAARGTAAPGAASGPAGAGASAAASAAASR
jgi:membrane fusion protein (multidrug efflux system)